MDLLQGLKYVFLFMLGSALGSFYNVLIFRLPRNMSIISPSSHCPSCGKSIRWYHNIPLLSYLFLRGRCAYCGAPISLRYPLVEAFSGLIAVVCSLRFEGWLLSSIFFIFFSILLVASLIDWDTFILPDSLTLGGLAFGLATSTLREDFGLVDSLLGAFLGGGSFLLVYLYYTKLRKIEGLGFGDVKLMAFIGSVGGVMGVAYAVFIGSLIGLAYALPIIIRNKSLQFVMPFGPFLSLGVFLGLVFKPESLLF